MDSHLLKKKLVLEKYYLFRFAESRIKVNPFEQHANSSEKNQLLFMCSWCNQTQTYLNSHIGNEYKISNHGIVGSSFETEFHCSYSLLIPHY